MKLIFLSMLAALTLAGKAQPYLTPSNIVFDKTLVNSTSYEMNWYMIKDSLPKQIGRVTTQILKEADKLTVVTEVNLANMKTPWIDSSVARLENLQPVWHASRNMQREMVLHFGKVVTGYYRDLMNKTNVIIRDTTHSDYFDSNLYPVLIGWLPLQEGYTQDLRIYDYNPAAKMGVISASIKKVSSGSYQSEKNGLRKVWVVTVTDEIGSGANGESTYYFDKTDRRLWKQEINVNGRKMTMQLAE